VEFVPGPLFCELHIGQLCWKKRRKRVSVRVFYTTFNNILVISWRSVLLVEEARIPGENHQPAASHWPTLSHNVASSTSHLSGIRTHNVSGDRH